MIDHFSNFEITDNLEFLINKFYEIVAYRCMQDCKILGHLGMTRLVVNLGHVQSPWLWTAFF